MEITKAGSVSDIEAFIETEQEKYEAEKGVLCNYSPFCFAAKHGNEIMGAVSGAGFFSGIYIDEPVVKDGYRGKDIGTQLIGTVEESFSGQGFHKMNLCTNGFQASGFYEKCGFKLEFIRENKSDPGLNK